MYITKSTKGFTLIELLVVITIIGILATGGVVTYTSSIQKSRDATRLKEMNALNLSIEQYYQDKQEYPAANVSATDPKAFSGILMYSQTFPKDTKSSQSCNKGNQTNPTGCDYMYNVADDINGIANGEFKISTGFENSGNVSGKALVDGGTEQNRFEMGKNLSNSKSTVCDRPTGSTFTATATAVAAAANCTNLDMTKTPIIIAG